MRSRSVIIVAVMNTVMAVPVQVACIVMFATLIERLGMIREESWLVIVYQSRN